MRQYQDGFSRPSSGKFAGPLLKIQNTIWKRFEVFWTLTWKYQSIKSIKMAFGDHHLVTPLLLYFKKKQSTIIFGQNYFWPSPESIGYQSIKSISKSTASLLQIQNIIFLVRIIFDLTLKYVENQGIKSIKTASADHHLVNPLLLYFKYKTHIFVPHLKVLSIKVSRWLEATFIW